MTARRHAHTLASPALTGGDDRPETPCQRDLQARRAVREVTGEWVPTPYDVLTDYDRGPRHKEALTAAKILCGQCPIQTACLRANRGEEWVEVMLGYPRRRSPITPERRARQAARDKLRIDTVTALIAQGAGIAEVLTWLGISRKAFRDWCKRVDRLDLWRTLTADEPRHPNQHTKKGAA